jgi:translation initiation factor IF-3
LKKIQKEKDLVNEEINFEEILLILPDGSSEKISSEKALEKANEFELDLVCVSPKNKPPVCKLLNYDHYRYEKSKREKEQKKIKQKEIKELQLSPFIDQRDLEIKAKKAAKWLQSGDSVKITMRLNGRMITKQALCLETIDKALKILEPYGTLEGKVALNRKTMIGLVVPN